MYAVAGVLWAGASSTAGRSHAEFREVEHPCHIVGL